MSAPIPRGAPETPSRPDDRPPLDPAVLRGEFPLLAANPDFAYLDSAATTQKPGAVLDALDRFYRESNANVHRGLYPLAEKATAAYEGARGEVAHFLGALAREVVWTRGTTESINLVAQSWGRASLGPGDAVLLTGMEHHAGLVPWQILAAERGFELRFLPFDARGELELERLEALFEDGRVRLVGVVHGSNVLGTINPVERIAAFAHERGALVLVDAAQTVPHRRVDVRSLGADFLAFSGHKAYGPTGIGVLWAREALLETMPPWQGGGDMILSVRLEKSTWNELPYKFEAGTPDIAGAVGLAAALRWLDSLGRDRIAEAERSLTAYAVGRLAAVEGLRLLGEPDERGPLAAFDLEGVHPHDVAQFLGKEGLAVRSGHHCAQPVHRELGLAASARASFAVHTTRDEIDRLAEALVRCRRYFS